MAMRELPPGVSLIQGRGDLPAVRVDTKAGEALVYLHGAQVAVWSPKGFGEVLWCSTTAVFDGRAAIRGGIPLCGPWFGAGVEGDRKPSHGWFRTSTWEFDQAAVNRQTGEAFLTFTLDGRSANLPEGQSGSLRAEYAVTVGVGVLELALTVEAIGAPTSVETALHTYLAVPDVAQACVTGLDGIGYLDKLTGEEKVQSGAVRFTEALDRVYHTAGPVSLTDQSTGRRVNLSKRGSADTVLWNPGERAAREMSDVGPDQWRSFVCAEAGNVGPNAVSLAAGERATTTARYEVAY